MRCRDENYKLIFRAKMISTRLKKQASSKSLLVEFATDNLPSTLALFYENCREQGLRVRKDRIPTNEINFYHVDTTPQSQISEVLLVNLPQAFTFALSVVYVTTPSYQPSRHKPPRRTLLLRQGLDSAFYFNYEWENTQSEKESIVYLCELAAALINSRLQQDISFYDQRTEQIRGHDQQSPTDKLWRNLFYQIPGLGRQKCEAIVAKYPNYESLLQDWRGPQQLKHLSVARGTKQMKLGLILSTRIYKCLFSSKGQESIYEQ